LYRQGRFAEAAKFAANCRALAAADDVSSQFLWRCVEAKLLARNSEQGRADELIREGLELIGASDFLNLQGNGFMDLAEVRRLCGDAAGALDALTSAIERFEAKGNIVSARSAELLAAELRAAVAQPAS
jgi:hypothetical protein